MTRLKIALRVASVLIWIGGVATAQTGKGAESTGHECFPGSGVVAELPSEGSPAPLLPGACPCFDREELEVLSGHDWDLCVHSRFVDQVSSWYGRRTASGQAGFNVVVVRRCPRSPKSSCLFLHRIGEDDAGGQIYRREGDLTDDEVDSCGRLLTDWLATLGGCQLVVASGPSD